MEQKKIIGYTTGVFDLFHIGHLNLLKRAKSQCDFLIVGVTTDKLCLEGKGITTVMPENERFQIIDSIKYVDKVIYQDTYDKIKAYHDNKFDVMFVGDDWKGTERWKILEKDFQQYGVEIIYFKYSDGVSSTILRAKLKDL